MKEKKAVPIVGNLEEILPPPGFTHDERLCRLELMMESVYVTLRILCINGSKMPPELAIPYSEKLVEDHLKFIAKHIEELRHLKLAGPYFNPQDFKATLIEEVKKRV